MVADATRVIVALLALYPPTSPAVRRIAHDRAHVVAVASSAADSEQVPIALLVAVGFLETWCGTHPHEGGGWGAPRPHQRNRHLAGTAADAAHVLARGLRACGSWRGSAAWFRSGYCQGSRLGDPYSVRALSIAERLSSGAVIELPGHWR